MIITRRALLLAAPPLVTAAYAGGLESMSLQVARYKVAPPAWPRGFSLKIAVVADVHACNPWMSVARIEGIVETTNALRPDVIVLLGDYVAAHNKITSIVADADWARALAALRAPSGVCAVLGNHDWWADRAAMRSGRGPIAARRALEHAGVPVLENETLRCAKGAQSFWIAGLGDQEAFHPLRRRDGADDLDRTLAAIADDAPAILLAHEPDIFPKVPSRIALTLSGHTHGGQVCIAGYAPVTPSPLSRRYLHGHFIEDGRHLIVSAGLGCSWWPVRLGAPPEIVVVELAAPA